MFHVNDPFVKSTSSIGIQKNKATGKSFVLPVVISLLSCGVILFWLISSARVDPFIQDSMRLIGSDEKGSSLFRMNCVGCHGISAQGLVGPSLNGVTNDLSDQKIINQVTKGLTPPMPSFEMDSQSMADLLAYLHSLD